MADLLLRGNTGISPSRSRHSAGVGTTFQNSSLEEVLHRVAPDLALPTGERAPVVGDIESEASGFWIRIRHGKRDADTLVRTDTDLKSDLERTGVSASRDLPKHAAYRLFDHGIREKPLLPSACNLLTFPVKKPIYFDVKQHLQDWHRYVLPIFVVVAAIGMVVFLIARTGEQGESLAEKFPEAARIGLLAAEAEPVFDPAFAVLSPIEMVLAPSADTFDFPVGSEHGGLTYNAQPFLVDNHLGDDLNGIGGQNSDLGEPVYAVGDGVVVFAGWPSDGWGNVVVLAHQLANGEIVESFYGHLDSIHVPVGKQVRRSDQIGTIGSANGRYLAHLHFEIRRFSTLDVGAGYADSELGRVSGELALNKWQRRAKDRLVAAPRGTPLEPRALQVDGVDSASN